MKEQHITLFKVNDLGNLKKAKIELQETDSQYLWLYCQSAKQYDDREYKKQKRIVVLVNNKAKIPVTLSCFNYCYSIVIGGLVGYFYYEADVPVDNRHISSCKTIPSTQHLWSQMHYTDNTNWVSNR